MINRRLSIVSILAVILCLGQSCAVAAQDFPTRPIRLVVPYPAGGPTDFVGRTLADVLQKALKQSVVVENKSGAAGTIGSDSVAKSAPDGYTLLLGLTGPISIAPKISPDLPYNPLKDFAPVRLVATMPEILVARPTLGLRTLRLDYAKGSLGSHISFGIGQAF